MATSKPDLYETLNVPQNASIEEIKKSFKKLAIQFHPDKCRNDTPEVKADKEETFKKLNEAHSILSDPEKKARYDMYGVTDNPQQMGGDPMNMSDILRDLFGGGGGFPGGMPGMPGMGGGMPPGGFSFVFMDGNGQRVDMNGAGGGGPMPPGFEALFGGGPQGRPQRNKQDTIDVLIDINDIYYGETKKVEFEMLQLCEYCKGSGAQDPSHLLKCMTCQGHGVLHQQVAIFTQTVPCHSCGGEGTTVQHNKQCMKCKGKKTMYAKKAFELKLPKGIPNNYEVVMEGKGSYNNETRRNNDMRFKFVYHIQEPYKLDDEKNVHINVKITLEELLAGFSKEIELYKEKLTLASEHYFNPTKTILVQGKGLYDMHAEKQRDLHIHFEVQYSENERYKKYADVLRKVLKKPVTNVVHENSAVVDVTESLNNLSM